MSQPLTIRNIELFRNILFRFKKELSDEFIEENVKFTIGEEYQLKNTPLYLVLEAHVKNRENEDDYGLCLTVTYQKYNPSDEKLIVSENEIYVLSDLTRGDGQIISTFGIKKVELNKSDYTERINEINQKVLEYLDSQVLVIKTLLKDEYLS